MNNFRKDMLFGILDNGNFIFGEVSITQDKTFSMSFDEVQPINIYDAERMAEDYIDGYDDASKFKILEYYNCCPSEMIGNVINNEGVQEILDCSLFYSEIKDNYFLSRACGQWDYRKESIIVVATDKDRIDTLMELWDNKHLKQIDDETIKRVINIAEKLPEKYSDEAEKFISELLDD